MKLKFSPFHPQYADLIPRFTARLIDFGLFTSIFLFGAYAFILTLTPANFGLVLLSFMAFWLIPYFFICLLYFPLMHNRFGATIGQLILGLKVVNKSNHFLSFRQAFFRHIIATIPINATLGLGYLSIATNSKHQGWHDQFTGSFVTGNRSKLTLGLIISILLLFTLTISGFLTISAFISAINLF